MSRVWSEEAKLARWLEVELAALDGLGARRRRPRRRRRGDPRARATPPAARAGGRARGGDEPRRRGVRRRCRRDARRRTAAGSTTDSRRRTSSTRRSSLQIGEAGALAARRARPRVRRGRRARGGASRHAHDRPDARRPCRADHVRAEARRLGVRARPRPGARRAGARGHARRQALRRRRPVRSSRAGGRARSPASGSGSSRRRRRRRSSSATGTPRSSRRSALLAASLERFATEIRHLARTEVREVQEPFGRGQKGSSAMPHKRNPIVAERICGLARVVRGHVVTALENVALWHERDISHSSAERVILPDAFLAVDYMLDRFTWLVEGLVVFPERMRANVESSGGLFFSQRLAARARRGRSGSRRGLPARPAARAARVGRGARLPRARPGRRRSSPAALDLDAVFDLDAYTRHVDVVFERLRALAQPCGAGACLKRPSTSAPARSASSTRSATTGCCSSPPTASRPSTSSCRRRSPTRGACSRGSRPSGSRARVTSSRTTCSRCGRTAARSSAAGSRCCPLEFVVRGYLAGSGWRDYLATGATSGHRAPAWPARVRAVCRSRS